MSRIWPIIAALVLVPAAAAAFSINGMVVNGTTGEPMSTTVLVVKPAGGMMVEQNVEAQDGRFTVENLDPKAPIYLIRVDYEGVMYNEPVRVTGSDVDVTVRVYETTTSWDGVHVSSPSIVASRTGEELEIERVYDVRNETDPPRAVAGDEAVFRFALPADMVELKSCRVTAMGVPIDRTPVPTDEPGLHRLDYPLRPGLTRFTMTYTVPYASGSYTLRERVPYPVDDLTIFQIDPDMEITGGGVDFGVHDASSSMQAYHATDVPADTEITIAFSGGSSAPAGMSGATSGGGSGTVMILPNAMEEASIMVMVIILLALLALTGVSIHGVANPLEEDERLRAHYDKLVQRLARLDDLYAAQTIPVDVYPVKRAELKQQLASLRYRLQPASASDAEAGTEPGDRSTQVAGEEQTSTT